MGHTTMPRAVALVSAVALAAVAFNRESVGAYLKTTGAALMESAAARDPSLDLSLVAMHKQKATSASCGCSCSAKTAAAAVAAEQSTGCTTTAPIDLVFVVDGSGSVGASAFATSKTFITDVMASFTIGSGADQTRVGVVQFSSSAQTELSLTGNEALATSEVNSMSYMGGGTDTSAAINYAVSSVFSHARTGVQKVMIVMTDGQSADAVGAAADAARAAGIEVFALGIGSGIGYSELFNIAGGADNVLTATSYDALTSMVTTIACTVTQTVNQDDCDTDSEFWTLFLTDGELAGEWKIVARGWG